MSRVAAASPDIQSGKRAFKALGKAYGGQEAVEAETGVRQQKISDMGNPNSQIMPPLDLIDLLEDRTVGHPGWPHVTNWLCRRRGGVFVPLPEGPLGTEAITGCVFEMAAELGDVSRCIGEALSDGEVSPKEAAAANLELDQLINTAIALRHRLLTIANGHKL